MVIVLIFGLEKIFMVNIEMSKCCIESEVVCWVIKKDFEL